MAEFRGRKSTSPPTFSSQQMLPGRYTHAQIDLLSGMRTRSGRRAIRKEDSRGVIKDNASANAHGDTVMIEWGYRYLTESAACVIWVYREGWAGCDFEITLIKTCLPITDRYTYGEK